MTSYTNNDIQCTDKTKSPLPTDSKNRSARFWNWIADRYSAKPVANEDVYEAKLAKTRDYLHPDSELLELGCGTGSTALLHAPYVKRIIAIDFSSKMIEIANDKAKSEGVDNVDFVCGHVNAAVSTSENYDVILALSLLHLLDDWPVTIQQAYRILKPGGVFVTSTLCLQGNHKLMQLVTPVGFKLGLLPHISYFSRAELEQAMFMAGFQIEHAWQATPKSGVFLIARKWS